MKASLPNILHVVNAATAGGVIATETIPENYRGWALFANILIAALLPSFAGRGHRVFFKTDQVTGKAIRAFLVGLVGLSMLAATAAPARAAEHDTSLEFTVIGNVLIDANDPGALDGDGQGLSFGADFPIRRGYLSANVEMQRLDNFGNPEIGAFNVDALMRLNILPGKVFSPYIGIGFGAVWLDRMTEDVTVEVDEGPDVTVPVELKANFTRWDAEGGFTWSWGETGFGLVGKYRFSQPIDQALDLSTAEWAVGLRMPTPKGL